MTNTFSSAVAFIVSDELGAAGISWDDAARRTGIKKKTLRRRLHGDSPLRVEELVALAAVIDMSAAEVVSRAARLTAVTNDPNIAYPAYDRPKCTRWCTRDHDDDDEGTHWCQATVFENDALAINVSAYTEGLLPSQTVVEHPGKVELYIKDSEYHAELDAHDTLTVAVALAMAADLAKDSARVVQR